MEMFAFPLRWFPFCFFSWSSPCRFGNCESLIHGSITTNRFSVTVRKMACANDAPPLLLPWTNVTVSKDGNAVVRGIELGVGTPNQIFSLRPSVGDVNTWLFNIATCGSASNDSCIGLEGGAYDPQDSSTYQLTTQARWNGSQSTNEQGSFIYFNDDINFGRNGTAYGYPMFLDQPGQGKLQLGFQLSKRQSN